MVPSHQIIVGYDAGYRLTYVASDGVIKARTNWLKVEEVDHLTGVIHGICKHTGDPISVSMVLIHTICSPYEHL